MQIKRRKKFTINILLFFIVFLFDQITKFYATSYLETGKSVSIFGGILDLTLVKNTGGVFGIFQGLNNFYIFLSIIFLIFIGIYYKKFSQEKLLLEIGLIVIIAGAVGNLLDRIRYGYVIDFIDIKVWPVFNFADVGIVCGCMLILYSLLFDKL